MARKVSAIDSINKLRRCEHMFSLAHISRLLEAREIKASRALLCRIVSDDPDQRRDASEELRAELQILASELC